MSAMAVEAAVAPVSPTTTRKASTGEAKEKEKRYKCQFCNRMCSAAQAFALWNIS